MMLIACVGNIHGGDDAVGHAGIVEIDLQLLHAQKFDQLVQHGFDLGGLRAGDNADVFELADHGGQGLGKR